MNNKELPPLPKHLMIFDQSDDSCFGSLVEHAWDSDYATMKVGDPMFTADQMHDYARAALAAQPEPDFDPFAGHAPVKTVQTPYGEATAYVAAQPEPAAQDIEDAERWRAFISLPYAVRSEWATNLSLAPVLTGWVDSRASYLRAGEAPARGDDGLSESDANQLELAIGELEDDGETMVDYDDLMWFALRGYLHCKYFEVKPGAQEAIDTARAAPTAQEASKPARTLLEQHDLDQSPDYRKGYEDGRLKGFDVGQRYAQEASKPVQAEAPSLSDYDPLIEQSLGVLVDLICPGIDSGDLVADAQEAMRVLNGRATQPPAIPAAPAVQDSGEREAYVRYLTETYPDNYSQEDAERWWRLGHVSALPWQARAAHSPASGAVEREALQDLLYAQHARPSCQDGAPHVTRCRCVSCATERASAALSTQPQQVGWMPIETAPKDGTMFLCWVHAEHYGETDEGQQYQHDASQVDFCWWRQVAESPDGGYFDPACGQIGDRQFVTHWMPLPPVPGQEGGAHADQA